jgi:CRISPR/Cas system-associated endonuclease Cas1
MIRCWDCLPAFVFDLMEPERPKVDRVVLSLLKSEVLHPADFAIRERGWGRETQSGVGGYRFAAKRTRFDYDEY